MIKKLFLLLGMICILGFTAIPLTVQAVEFLDKVPEDRTEYLAYIKKINDSNNYTVNKERLSKFQMIEYKGSNNPNNYQEEIYYKTIVYYFNWYLSTYC